MKCHKNFDHFNYSLRMNKKNILDECVGLKGDPGRAYFSLLLD